MPPRERPVGRVATWDKHDPNVIPQVQIGGQIFTGTAMIVTRYTSLGGRRIIRLQLVDAICLEDAGEPDL